MRIMKFGGSSLANPERIGQVIHIIRDQESRNSGSVVVVSAMSGVTNQLVKLCELITSPPGGSDALIRELEQRHLASLKSLLPVKEQPAAMAEIIALCNELSDIAKGASLVGEVTPRTQDLILSFGERLSAYLVCQAAKISLPEAVYADARVMIKTDSSFGNAKVDMELTSALIKEYFSANKGLKIVTGFIASTVQNQTTTLGRNGSDYTASILGAALGAETIEIWSDTDGVMTADPSYVKEARSIGQLSYSEAMELSHFGAKVLFPASLHPAMAKQIPIVVKNTFNSAHAGTLISGESSRDNGFIKGITSLENMCMITIEGSGMVGVAGVSARMFSSLSKQNISVILISQASSEHSICIAVMQDDADKAVMILNTTFMAELQSGLISSVNHECNLAIVAVVGENMRHTPGVAGRVFSPLGRNGINLKAISQGSSELNISFVINNNDLKKTLRVLHQALFNKEIRQLHLYIAGTGSVGGRLLEMMENHNDYLAKKKINLQLLGLINSRKMIIGTEAVDLHNRKSVMENSPDKADLQGFVGEILAQNMENSVFIDVTAADEPVDFYNKLLSSNITIVAANKRANTRDMEQYRLLHSSAKNRNISFNYETNVGAGLPVINVIRNILAGGDKVTRIEAVLSGTINWLFSEYDGTKPFSDMVKVAKERGYTEPDPRDDLSGTDVARKCLILARECGLELELGDISVQPLMPDEASEAGDLAGFFQSMKSYDPIIRSKYAAALEVKKKLRYVGKIADGVASVELAEVGPSNPFYSLAGSENCIILTTNYYKQYPMVIKGPGAGVDVTAAGLLADIVRIAEDVRIY